MIESLGSSVDRDGGYLSKDRQHLARLQRDRRARMVRIDYMPSARRWP